MVETNNAKKIRRPTPVLDTCVKVVCFTLAAFLMTGFAVSERRSAVEPGSAFRRAINGLSYHAGVHGYPFEYYAIEARYSRGVRSFREGYEPFGAIANVVFWAGCLGVSIILVHHAPGSRFTIREFMFCVTLLCTGLAIVRGGGLTTIHYATAAIGMCTLFCVTAVWFVQRIADICFDVLDFYDVEFQ